LGNTSRFYGLKVSTKGQVSLAGASLISKPLTIVANTLTVDDLLIQNNALRTDLSVTLPDPLNSGGPQKVNFSIDAQGHISGGAVIAVINEPEGVTGNADTHFAMGSVATVHLRYLGLNLDFANLKTNSSIQVIGDVYLENEEANRISLGDEPGGTVQPGLKIGFDGSVTWGNLIIAKAFDFDFDVVKLHVSDVAFPAQHTGFAISLSGALGLNVEDVTGSVNFHDFVVTSKGQVQFPPTGIDGGHFEVANEVTIDVAGFGYSGTPTTLRMVSGTMPNASGQGGKADTVSVNVLSYLTFGGDFSIENEVSGGVDRFLFYRGADSSVHLVIQNANVKIEDLADLHLDLTYAHTNTGYQIAVGGAGKIYQYQGVVVGAIEKDGPTPSRMGLFLAANGLNINITPYIRLDGAGGGFFLHPRVEWINMVRSVSGVAQTGGMTISPDTSDWAVMMYGKVTFLQGVITGTSLTTISNTQILMDGSDVILGQDGHITGDHHLAIGLKSAYAEGTMNASVNYDGVVTATGPMSFYVYSDTAWAVMGSTTVNVVSYIKGTSDFYVGPPGFYVKAHVAGNYNIAILSVGAAVDATVWYLAKDNQWGGYTSFDVSASVLGGLASATGTLRGALILTDGTPYMFAAADLKATAAGQSWDGWVWAKFRNGQASAGLGADQSILDAISEAQSVSDSLAAAKSQAQAALASVQSVVPGTAALTPQELVAAYQNITGNWNSTTFIFTMKALQAVENYLAPQPAETTYQANYVALLLLQGAPGDTTAIRKMTDGVNNAVLSLHSTQPQVQNRISALALSIQPLAAGSASPTLPTGSPVTSASLSPPVTQDVVGADGLTYRHTSGGPSLAVDEVAAQNQRTSLTAARQQADAADLAIRQQIAAMETGLSTVQSATAGADASALPALVGQYAAVESQAEHQYAAQADFFLQRQDWMRAQLVNLASWDASWITTKDAALAAGKSQYLANLDSALTGALDAFAGTNLQSAFGDSLASTNPATHWPFLQRQADTASRQLWIHIAQYGMQDAVTHANDQYNQLTQTAAQRLASIRSGHAAVSASLANLYGVQAQAEGALYDLYDRYVRARSADTTPPASTLPPPLTGGAVGGKQTVSMVDQLLDLTFLKARRDQIAEDLTVPRINRVQVVPVASDKYTTQLQFSWSGWHPSSVYEFEFADADVNETAPDLLSNGAAGSLTSYRFTQSASAATVQNRVFSAGVRGGAGYLGLGRTTYSVSFAPASNTVASFSGGTSALVDNTPPSTPLVSFPGLGEHVDANGVTAAWTSTPTQAPVTWSADDPESGVSQYEYAVWSNPTGSNGSTKGVGGMQSLGGSPVLQAFTAVGGRTDATLSQITLKAGQPLYVAVRATNGQGSVSDNGVSMPLRYDPSPPVFPAGAVLAPPIVVSPFVSTLSTSAPCPVTQPAFPGATVPAAPTVALPSSPWSGTLSSKTDGGTPATPVFTLNRPDATDNESGVANYYYHVATTATDTVFSGSWTPTYTRTSSIVISGSPLDYVSQFYVVLVAQNNAGGISSPLVYGPFRVPDPTPPTTPVYCAGPGAAAGQLATLITTPSSDPETGLLGYQYRIRTAAGAVVRDWPTAAFTDWAAAGSASRVATGTLADGQSYFVDVRAVNKQGEISPAVSSGPVLYDVSPPPNPGASVTNSGGVSTLSVSATTDPNSGLLGVQWSIGSTTYGTDLVPWAFVSVPSAGG
ncbi:MAG TPA: hypothetical protein VJS20_07705, partial [Gemmatimonadales bacterium]|nr:hypothetical protein [Gemmatimonadales bacterium]